MMSNKIAHSRTGHWHIFAIFILNFNIPIGSPQNPYSPGRVLAEKISSSSVGLSQQCDDCQLTSQSIEELIRKPRQMDPYGQMSDRVDLDKIKKAVCKEIANDQERERCRSFYFGHLDAIERWRHQQGKISFLDFVCIREMKLCCPSGSYGPKCTRCTRCATLNEHCHGEGTRTGNGTCVCKLGHTGPNCANCLPGYYHYYNNDNNNDIDNDKQADEQAKYLNSKQILCKPCHRSCKYCRAAGSQGCEVCAKGFVWVPGFGCSDVDECLDGSGGKKICGDNTFCVNTFGSYFCYECDRACDGCHGDGPDMCLRCGKNYKLENGNCIAERKTILPPEANYYRLVGLGVALYIGASEYVMSGNPGLVAHHSPGAVAHMSATGGLSSGLSLGL